MSTTHTCTVAPSLCSTSTTMTVDDAAVAMQQRRRPSNADIAIPADLFFSTSSAFAWDESAVRQDQEDDDVDGCNIDDGDWRAKVLSCVNSALEILEEGSDSDHGEDEDDDDELGDLLLDMEPPTKRCRNGDESPSSSSEQDGPSQ